VSWELQTEPVYAPQNPTDIAPLAREQLKLAVALLLTQLP